MDFTFLSYWLLILLLLIPCLFWCKQYPKTFYFPKLEWIGKEFSLLRWEMWIKSAIFALIVFALANPIVYENSPNSSRKGRDLILALDASGSMAQSGFDTSDSYISKYEKVQQLAQEFIKVRTDDNIGVVIFGTFAYTASPLTYDLTSLNYLLGLTTVGVAGENTAIGDALVQSLRTLDYGEAKNKAIILLTDGFHNAGKHSPRDAVEMALKKGVKIYTVGIGSSIEYDTALLKQIAQESKGGFYGAESAKELREIFDTIQSLEPSNLRSENYLDRTQLYVYPLFGAFVLLLLWLLFTRRGIL